MFSASCPASGTLTCSTEVSTCEEIYREINQEKPNLGKPIFIQLAGLIRDVDHYYDLYTSLQNSPDAGRRLRTISRMHQSLIQAQELGDEKMQIVNHMQEIIDGKLRQLDTDQQNLDLKEERERYATLLEDGQPSKLQRLQSPMREQANQGMSGGNGGLNGNGLAYQAKDHYGLNYGGVVPGLGAISSGNGGRSTPNSERSSHVSNGGNNGSTGNMNGGAGGDLQRTGSKRSRRRNESLANNGSSLEMGGNESNSANEAGGSGSGGGGSGERKSSLGGGGGAGQGRKSSLQAAGGSLASGSAGTSSGAGGGGAGASGSGAAGGGGGNNSGKKKKRKVRGAGASNANTSTREETPPPETIDPDEPTYCVCNQVIYKKPSFIRSISLTCNYLADILRRDDSLRQRLVPYRMVPLFVRLSGAQAQRQVVLPELPGRTTQCDEAQGPVPKGAGALQQGEGGKDLEFVLDRHRIYIVALCQTPGSVNYSILRITLMYI